MTLSAPKTDILTLFVVISTALSAVAQEKRENDAINWRSFDPPPAPALSPEEALRSFRLPPGFRIELVAAEPLIEDPVAAVWDADGRLWVAEMRGYMHDTTGSGENAGIDRVVVLEDEDGDGRMDRSTTFLDGLVMPRAIAPVEGGVLIAEPPRIWFCQDTDGDLVCDRKTEVSASYGQRDAVSRTASGLMRALDNWIYSSRHPVRFQFRNGELNSQADVYRGDYGVAQDDFGRIYANTNSSWLHADVAPSAYLLRHPNLLDPAGLYEKIVQNQSVHSIRVNTGVNQGLVPGMLRPDGRLARTTAATWPCIYRGDQFPAQFSGNAFIPEPAGNVVARFELANEGIRPKTERRLTADPDWGQRDFLASTDERFRPVQCATGPDGCLYVIDFYRGIIEYKLFVTPFLAEQIKARQLDRPLGLGRIYRIVHDDKSRPSTPVLSKATTMELAGLLSHANGWIRDTAQRLLVERADPESIDALRKLAHGSDSARSRVHALWTLHGMGSSNSKTILAALHDEHPRVRIAAAEIGDSPEAGTGFLKELLTLTSDPEPEVRLQALLSLGEFSDRPEAHRAMIEVLAANGSDRLFRHAALSGLAGVELEFLRQILETPESPVHPLFLRELASLITRSRQPERIGELLILITEIDAGEVQTPLLAGIATAFRDPKPILMPEEPRALITLRKKPDEGVRKWVDQINDLLTWPGDTALKKDATVLQPLSEAERERFEKGREVYRETCMACHQIHGQGMVSLAPPLVDSQWVLGNEERLIRIVLHGLHGPVTVRGKTWNLIMPGQDVNPKMTDENIAAVATYVRRAWGHAATPVDAETVKRIRAATSDRVLPWTVKELD